MSKIETKVDPMVEVAKQWAALRNKEKKIEAARKEIGAHLLEKMRNAGQTSVEVGKGVSVRFMSTKQKRLSKTIVIQHFGKEVGDAFWLTLKDDVSEYLSLTNEREREE